MAGDDVRELLLTGAVIPAHPLALTRERRLDERRQRALTRYYLAAGVGGVAVAVHTTQFRLRDPAVGLLEPVLELAARTIDTDAARPIALIAGVCGPVAQAVAEAELAASLGYHAVLLTPDGPDATESDLLDRAKAVAQVLPVVGFYLQTAVGGPVLSLDYWRRFVEIPEVVAVKAAPFDRYRTLDVARAIGESGRARDIALYTGNDDAIIPDLLAEYRFGDITLRTAGGLLGQWAVWTRAAVRLHADVSAARDGDREALARLVRRTPELTDANSAVFDAANGFAGCIAGVHEVLRRQGLLAGIWCLDPDEVLSPGQAEELTRVTAAYPWLLDDDFVAEHLDDWLR
jgi:dihydrodipicolinate synthase/N-acetylneuraminate lyase